MNRTLITLLAGLLLCGLAPSLSAQTPAFPQGFTPKPGDKITVVHHAWGHDWHPNVPAGLRAAKGETLRRKGDPKRLLWVRILGEIEGKA